MAAILKRELSGYFNSAIAYVVLALFFFFSGFFFYAYCFVGDSASLSIVFANMFYIIMFIIPVLTMKTFADEKHRKTDELFGRKYSKDWAKKHKDFQLFIKILYNPR